MRINKTENLREWVKTLLYIQVLASFGLMAEFFFVP